MQDTSCGLQASSCRMRNAGCKLQASGYRRQEIGEKMPTYEYECIECGYRFEKFQKISEPPIKVCSRCKGKVNRLISAGCGLIFKGSGFYATDYKKRSSGKKSLKDRGGKEPNNTKDKAVKESMKEKGSPARGEGKDHPSPLSSKDNPHPAD